MNSHGPTVCGPVPDIEFSWAIVDGRFGDKTDTQVSVTARDLESMSSTSPSFVVFIGWSGFGTAFPAFSAAPH